MKKNTILAIVGLAGSGKTTIGRMISNMVGYTYLDKDTMSRDFIEYVLENKGYFRGDRECEEYTERLNYIEYKTMIDVAVENALLGNDVAISAPFMFQLLSPNGFKVIEDRIDPDKVKLKILIIYSTIEVSNIRIHDRNAARDKWKIDNWDEFEKIHAEVTEKLFDLASINDNFLIYDNSDSSIDLATAVRGIEKWLKK